MKGLWKSKRCLFAMAQNEDAWFLIYDSDFTNYRSLNFSLNR